MDGIGVTTGGGNVNVSVVGVRFWIVGFDV